MVVASHRHQDHISGFADRAVGATSTVGEVWLPWCENPADPEAQRLRTRLDAAARTLHQQFAADGAGDRRLALNSLSNERAMTTLRDGFAGQPGPTLPERRGTRTRRELAGLPDARIHLLGPSRTQEAIKAMDPPELERWLALSRASVRSAATPAGRPTARSARRTASPTGPSSGSAIPHLDVDDDLLDHRRARPRRRAGRRVLAGSGLNNTSLVFVLEIEDVRIVFPGDAQWGVWREILANTDARALLERTTLYKVSHHGSHNGSPKSLVNDVLPEHVTSMMSFRTHGAVDGHPADRAGRRPADPGRTLLRPDEDIPAAGAVGVGEVRRAADGLWTEIDLG